MHILRKYLALIALGESSQSGRMSVLRVIIDAALRAHADVDEPGEAEDIKNLLHQLANPDEWPESSVWLDAFEYRLSQVALAGPASTAGLN